MATQITTEVESSGLTHIGPVREDNQDAIRLPGPHYPAERGLLYAVADGMGGYANGQIASALALDTLYQAYYQDRDASAEKSLKRSVESANMAVYQAALNLAAGRMGTTLTAAAILGKQLFLGHVGDSRAYLIRGNHASCLTNDHTTVGDLVRMKVLTPNKVRTHAQRSVLNKAIGLGLFVRPDVTSVELRIDDRLILCSDGLWTVIEDDEFAQLADQVRGVQDLAQRLIDLALERDTDDNLSVIVIRIRHVGSASVRAGPGNRGWLGSLQNRFSAGASRRQIAPFLRWFATHMV